jgi:hypothetical protein
MITNVYEVKCDDCNEKEYFPSEGIKFKNLIEEIKNQGWFMIYNPETGKYSHYCENCATKFL